MASVSCLKHVVDLSERWFSKFLLQEWFRDHSKLIADIRVVMVTCFGMLCQFCVRYRNAT